MTLFYKYLETVQNEKYFLENSEIKEFIDKNVKAIEDIKNNLISLAKQNLQKINLIFYPTNLSYEKGWWDDIKDAKQATQPTINYDYRFLYSLIKEYIKNNYKNIYKNENIFSDLCNELVKEVIKTLLINKDFSNPPSNGDKKFQNVFSSPLNNWGSPVNNWGSDTEINSILNKLDNTNSNIDAASILKKNYKPSKTNYSNVTGETGRRLHTPREVSVGRGLRSK